MVDTNRLIAETNEAVRYDAGLTETLVRVRQRVFIDETLICTALRQMRIAIAGNPIR